MYSWIALRNWCSVLLLIPIVHLAYLVSGDTLALLDSSPQVWSEEVNAYSEKTLPAELPSDPIVVVGGRLVKLWPDLENLLAPRPVLMRGVGDATVNDITFHYEQLIGFYRPEIVVLLPGNSEFHIRDNKSAEELVAAVRELEAFDAAHGFSRKFYVFGPLKTVLHARDDETMDAALRQLQAWAETDRRIEILDANALLAGSNGRPDPKFFRGDGIHLNQDGYLRLSLLLKHRLGGEDGQPGNAAKTGRDQLRQ